MPRYTSTPSTTLERDDELVFKHKGETYKGHVASVSLHVDDDGQHNNAAILRAVFGGDYERAVFDIYGYRTSGVWPVACNLEDLTRLVRAIYARCDGIGAPEVEPEPKAGRKIEVGMLIRNLRHDPSMVGAVLGVEPLCVLYKDDVASDREPRDQCLTKDAEVRWPWETEWTRVKGEAPAKPKLAKFQIWKDTTDGECFICLLTGDRIGDRGSFTLYSLGNAGVGYAVLAYGRGLGSEPEKMEYVGMAKDVLAIKKPD